MTNNGDQHGGGRSKADGSSHAQKSDMENSNPFGDVRDEGDMKLDPAAQTLIGQTLKALYSEIVHEPIPDKLSKLLADLDRED